MSIFSALSGPINLMEKLLSIIKKFRKKQQIEDRFVNAFENEIETYLRIYKEMRDLSKDRVVPILDSVGDEMTPHDMNRLVEEFLKVPLLFSELVRAFISFAKACNEVVVLKGFMEDLHDNDLVLFDFVYTMKNTYVPENKAVIDARYYRYFQTYKADIFGNVRIKDIEEATKELRKYARKLKQFWEKTAFIKRTLRKKYVKNYRLFAKTVENLTVKPTSLIDLEAYVPEPLLPVVVVLEEMKIY
jgi:hypothetical protein